MRYHVYIHRTPMGNTPFYVGCGAKNRPYDFLKRSKAWKDYVAQYGLPIVQIVAIVDTKEDAERLERELIALYGRRDLGKGTLVNMTDGGNGISGVIRTAETRAKIGEAHKGNKYNFGKTLSDQIKAKLSETKRGGKNPQAKAVINLETGVFYSCVVEAAEAHGVNYSTLKSMLSGKSPNKTSLAYA